MAMVMSGIAGLMKPLDAKSHRLHVTSIAGGGGWIRTSVRVSGQIYSLLPLTTRPPLHSAARDYAMNLWRNASIPATKSHHTTGGEPCSVSQALAWPKWPHPTNGTGPRRADSGEGWLALSTKWRRVSIKGAFFWA